MVQKQLPFCKGQPAYLFNRWHYFNYLFICKKLSQHFSPDFIYWLLAIVLMAALLYYGLLPKAFIKINLRGTGWIKAFVIGFVWASCVNILPLINLKIERGDLNVDPVLVGWLFIKNFMFCTVNAIMFDIRIMPRFEPAAKDFCGTVWFAKTIFFILIPLLLIGVLSLILFTIAKVLAGLRLYSTYYHLYVCCL